MTDDGEFSHRRVIIALAYFHLSSPKLLILPLVYLSVIPPLTNFNSVQWSCRQLPFLPTLLNAYFSQLLCERESFPHSLLPSPPKEYETFSNMATYSPDLTPAFIASVVSPPTVLNFCPSPAIYDLKVLFPSPMKHSLCSPPPSSSISSLCLNLSHLVQFPWTPLKIFKKSRSLHLKPLPGALHSTWSMICLSFFILLSSTDQF